MAYSKEVKQKAKELWFQGISFEKIAELEDMPKTKDTIWEWSKKENWNDQLSGILLKAREKQDEKLSDDLVNLNINTYRQLLLIQGRITEHLSKTQTPLDLKHLMSTLDLSIRNTRLLAGEPGKIDRVIQEGTHEISLTKRELIDRIKDKVNNNKLGNSIEKE